MSWSKLTAIYFDRSRLRLKPLAERVHDLDLSVMKSLSRTDTCSDSIRQTARRIVSARKSGSEVVMMIGGHVIRSGTQRYIIDLLEKGHISCIATNGSCAIHDFELSLIGATTESVAKYVSEGQFGLWEETSRINDIVNDAHASGKIGMGKAIGKAIYDGNFPNKELSVFAACYRLKIPITVHVGIGHDIIHEHPNFDGAAAGATSYLDFLRFAKVVENLENGVVMNFGSSVMAPEVFLKALSMARNVAGMEERRIVDFTTLVCDLLDLPEEVSAEPSKEETKYYFRPWKTMLVRTVADGGKSFYAKGKHSDTIPELWTAIQEESS